MRIILFIILFWSFSLNAFEGAYTVVVQKQQQKAQTRWTLSDWLLTKKKMALMDQWLALHSSYEIFEWVLGWNEGGVKVSSTEQPAAFEYFSRQFYSEIFVYFLGIGYEDSYARNQFRDLSYIAKLRILGTNTQTTHFNLIYGYRKLNETSYGKFDQDFFGVSGALYLLPFLGIKSSFYKYMKSKKHPVGFSLTGEKFSYSPFIELGPIRFTLDLYKENFYFNALSNSLTDNKKTQKGVHLGVSLIF
ncbi:MAG: hypothetical protein ACO20H_03320 [Bacteriovoracaceae bacterium]